MSINPQKLKVIRKKAKQSTCRFKVAAFGLNRNGDIVSKHTNYPRFYRKGGGIHAEMAVMREARKKGVVSILLCRVGQGQGELRPIDPCPTCQKKADELGIKIYSISQDSHG